MVGTDTEMALRRGFDRPAIADGGWARATRRKTVVLRQALCEPPPLELGEACLCVCVCVCVCVIDLNQSQTAI